MKKVLIISYYFPPMGMGGVQRALKFAKYLPSFGWQPIILTVKDVEYFAKDYTLLEELTEDTKIIRTGSFDPLRLSHILTKTKSHQSKAHTTRRAQIQSWIFFPDNKIGWLPFAASKAIRLIWKEDVSMIFSTSPPPTSHVLAYLLKRMTKKAWVADFRDHWIGFRYETLPTLLHRKLRQGLEKLIATHADAITTVNPKISQKVRQTNPQVRRVETITNGFDQDDFRHAAVRTDHIFTILHSGTFSPDHDPSPFLIALHGLLERKKIEPEKVKFLHCGLGLGIDIDRLIQKYQLAKLFSSLGYLSHLQAIQKLKQADLLLLTTASHPQAELATTGKLFEYLAARKPILAIVPKESVAAQIIQSTKSGIVIEPQEIGQIEEVLLSYYNTYYRDEIDFESDEKMISSFERKYLTSKLAKLFEELT